MRSVLVCVLARACTFAICLRNVCALAVRVRVYTMCARLCGVCCICMCACVCVRVRCVRVCSKEAHVYVELAEPVRPEITSPNTAWK